MLLHFYKMVVFIYNKLVLYSCIKIEIVLRFCNLTTMYTIFVSGTLLGRQALIPVYI